MKLLVQRAFVKQQVVGAIFQTPLSATQNKSRRASLCYFIFFWLLALSFTPYLLPRLKNYYYFPI